MGRRGGRGAAAAAALSLFLIGLVKIEIGLRFVDHNTATSRHAVVMIVANGVEIDQATGAVVQPGRRFDNYYQNLQACYQYR